VEGRERRGERREQRGLLVVDPLREREHAAGAEQRHRERPRAVQPPQERPREEQQPRPGDAAEQVRELEQGQRDDERQEVVEDAEREQAREHLGGGLPMCRSASRSYSESAP
jgi:hypothetical protein